MENIGNLVKNVKTNIASTYKTDKPYQSPLTTKDYFQPEIITYDLGCRNCTY